MDQLRDTQVGVLYLSWINEQLRQEIARREEHARQSQWSVRAKTAVVAGLTTFSLLVLRTIPWSW